MGKKPVIGLAGMVLASLALCGCQKGQYCNGGSCGSQGHVASGQGWQAQPGRTTSQPGGPMMASPTTSPGMTGSPHSTSGFTTVGTPTTGGTVIHSQPMTTSPNSPSYQRPVGTPTSRTMDNTPMPSTIHTGRPTMPVHETTVRPATVTTPATAPSSGIPQSSGIPPATSTVMPREMPATSGQGTLPPAPQPIEGVNSSSSYPLSPPPPSGVNAVPPPPVQPAPALEVPPQQ